jgi:hypothetical protein
MAGTRLVTQAAFAVTAAVLLVLLSIQQGLILEIRSIYNCYIYEPRQMRGDTYGAKRFTAADIVDALDDFGSSSISSPLASSHDWSKTRWRDSVRISFISLQEASDSYQSKCTTENSGASGITTGCRGLSRRRLIQRVISNSIAALTRKVDGLTDDANPIIADTHSAGVAARDLSVQSHWSRKVRWLDDSRSIDLPKLLDDKLPNELKIFKQWPVACSNCIDFAIYLYEAPFACDHSVTSNRGCAIKGIKSESQNWSKRVVAVSESVNNNAIIMYQVSPSVNIEEPLASELVSSVHNIIRFQLGLPERKNTNWVEESGVNASANHASSQLISKDELTWMHAAYISRVLNSVPVADTLTSLHCGNVLHWSREMHTSQYLMHTLHRINELRDSILVSIENNLKYRANSAPQRVDSGILTIDALLSRAILLDDELTRLRSNPDMHLPSLFPIEYRFALHAPFWIPILLPMLYGLVSEYKRYIEKQRVRMCDASTPMA